MAVTASDLMNELHIDTDDIETKTVQGLIDSAKEIVTHSVTDDLTTEQLETKYPKLFDLATKNLATSMYYDRELTNGTSKGFQMAIVHLSTRVAMDMKRGSDDGNNET
ncbi:phage gp6-like head-tail connector protein [Pediococcus acidilactici]|jgi:predicted oxidoreductase|uniref:head-tail connector protein n=1 Tax=Pediococcus acidilactici TaxID=1254 RepID=UPI000FE433AD|nr:head-tail connector protein [Pediococcus acidilactici]KAF0373143.1 DNA-packaging protein [Pediococcus acidilactici]KAF0383665.1 DNA-packaging protein [Pediococcus acidilactici]KAF0457651.1 DNA-packaging protein [Pediococcus acidilactici]KAF0476915.1 DNA-packaging protein [Pediococcus acidilactici]KAF0537441.1 DNA-packaging protein [Pediococcus acidilactici]